MRHRDLWSSQSVSWFLRLRCLKDYLDLSSKCLMPPSKLVGLCFTCVSHFALNSAYRSCKSCATMQCVIDMFCFHGIYCASKTTSPHAHCMFSLFGVMLILGWLVNVPKSVDHDELVVMKFVIWTVGKGPLIKAYRRIHRHSSKRKVSKYHVSLEGWGQLRSIIDS